jgi:signal transduction histidine kinase
LKFTIPKKIGLAFGILIILLILVGLIGIIQLNNAQHGMEKLVHESNKEKVVFGLQSDISSLFLAINNEIITGNKAYYYDYVKFTKRVDDRIGQLDSLLKDPDERQEFREIVADADSIKVEAPELFPLEKERKTQTVDSLTHKLDYKFDDNMNAEIKEFMEMIKIHASAVNIKVRRERKEAVIFTSATVVLALIISIIVIILTLKKISGPILKLVSIAQRIAARDFSVQLKATAKDEIGMLIIAFNAMIEEINKRYEELEKFSYVAAHDLKSPLSGIIGYSEILLEKYKNSIEKEDQELLNDIINSGNRMALLISDLLEFAKAGKIEFSKEPVSIGKMLEDICSDFKYDLKKKNVKLTIHDPMPSFICDPNHFPQVWSNLISNAIKYNDKPEPKIDIGTLDDKKNSNICCFYVKDNGIGVDKNYFDKLFNPFQRATTNPNYQGTGIGLAIVKRIIDFHGGKIWIESNLGEGTTIYFTIPKQFVLNGHTGEKFVHN